MKGWRVGTWGKGLSGEKAGGGGKGPKRGMRLVELFNKNSYHTVENSSKFRHSSLADRHSALIYEIFHESVKSL